MAARSFLSTLTGCFSLPADGNPTVVMMEAAYHHHGLIARYLNCQVTPEALGDAVRGAWAMGWVGFNCSLPHKVAVIAYLDELGPSAQIIGAVNCVVRQGERWRGENTDGQGFVSSLREVTDPAGKAVVVLGAGGAARAIAVEVALAGAASLTVLNRHRGRGEDLVNVINRYTPATAHFASWDDRYAIPAGSDIVVNATPVGMAPDVDAQPDIDLDSLRSGMVVADVVPNPPQTAFLTSAVARGCVTLDGLGMLINQGAINIRYWTGIEPERAVMRRALAEALSAS